MNIKTIPTKYNGVTFRSRTEARWAVYFDSIGIEWIYEHEGYDLGEMGWYVPDFYLPKHDVYAEVKPFEFTEVEKQKCFRLSSILNKTIILLDGAHCVKTYKTYDTWIFGNETKTTEAEVCLFGATYKHALYYGSMWAEKDITDHVAYSSKYKFW